MNKRGILTTAIALLTLLSITIASAEIIYSQPNGLYNIGDPLNLTIDLIAQADTSDFFTSTLVCTTKEVEIYKSPLTLKESDKRTILIQLNLDKFLIQDSQGQCHIKSTYGNEQSSSYEFEITSNIDTTINLKGIAFNPKDEIKATGQAIKSNGEFLNGFVDISFEEINLHYTNQVEDGQFNFNLTLPDNIEAGLHQLTISTYEKDSYGEITNQGNLSTTIKINQIPKKINIAFSSNTLIPGNEFTYTALVTDQAGNSVEQDVAVIIYKPDESVFEKNLVKVDEANSFITKPTAQPGYWKVQAEIQELITTRIFYVEELMQAEFNLTNTTMTAINTGNVPYDKPVEVSFGGTKELTNIKLEIGESRELRLAAPDGNYQIQVDDGSQNTNLGTTFLTGNAIAIKDISGALTANIWTILWILIIIILLVIAVILIRRYLKNKKTIKSLTPIKVTKSKPSTEPSSNIIDKGEKQESSVISLKIKNLDDLNKSSLQAVDSALWKIKESGAKIYSDSNYRIIILTPLLTKSKENTYKAVILAQTLERMLQQHNKRSQQKIDFGIGVHEGELIVESKNGKFKFISMGNTITLPKKISSHSNKEVLISEPFHRKTSIKVKAEKVHNANLWRIKRIIDRTQHEDFIKNFTRKQKSSQPHHKK